MRDDQVSFFIKLTLFGTVIIFLFLSTKYPFSHYPFWTATGKFVLLSLISFFGSFVLTGIAYDGTEEKYKKECDV